LVCFALVVGSLLLYLAPRRCPAGCFCCLRRKQVHSAEIGRARPDQKRGNRCERHAFRIAIHHVPDSRAAHLRSVSPSPTPLRLSSQAAHASPIYSQMLTADPWFFLLLTLRVAHGQGTYLLHHIGTCNDCGVDWCGDYPVLDQQSPKPEMSTPLVQWGCENVNGATEAWRFHGKDLYVVEFPSVYVIHLVSSYSQCGIDWNNGLVDINAPPPSVSGGEAVDTWGCENVNADTVTWRVNMLGVYAVEVCGSSTTKWTVEACEVRQCTTSN
jgi:hypothetical protein